MLVAKSGCVLSSIALAKSYKPYSRREETLLRCGTKLKSLQGGGVSNKAVASSDIFRSELNSTVNFFASVI